MVPRAISAAASVAVRLVRSLAIAALAHRYSWFLQKTRTMVKRTTEDVRSLQSGVHTSILAEQVQDTGQRHRHAERDRRAESDADIGLPLGLDKAVAPAL